jgi:heptaprenyl diphosphate synthase
MPEDLEKVSGIIKKTLTSQNTIINEGLKGLFEGNGKLLRPGLLLLAAKFGKVQDKHYDLAAGLEMLHMATLVHDDVIDDSPLRRGLPSLHSRYGKKDAVLIGDYLLSRSFLLAAKYTTVQNTNNLAHLISTICTMEIEQNSDRYKSNVSLRSYLRKITGKSALMFSIACFVGAHEAETSKELCERFRRIGYNIGMAFQIIDDVLDYEGDPDVVRKPLGNDIGAGLITLPVLCALRLEKTGALKDIFSRDSFTVDECKTIFSLVRSSGGTQEANKFAGNYTRRALKEISALPAGKNRDLLEKLTKQLLIRQE